MADSNDSVTTPVAWMRVLGRENPCVHCGERRAPRKASRTDRTTHRDRHGHEYAPSAPTAALAAALVIATYADSRTCFVHMGAATLAAHLAVSDRQAKRYLSGLVDAGYLVLVRRGRNHFGNPVQSTYRLAIPATQGETGVPLRGDIQGDGGVTVRSDAQSDTGVPLNALVQGDIDSSFKGTSGHVQGDTHVPLSGFTPSVHHQGQPDDTSPHTNSTTNDDEPANDTTALTPMPDWFRQKHPHGIGQVINDAR